MDYVKRFFLFWYHFLIGEDWIGSLIVLAGFGLTYFIAQTGIAAYWILMATVLISLSFSVWREVQQGSK
jgi:hypothetical protein